MKDSGADLQILKETNSGRIFTLLSRERRISRARLAKLSGLSRTTISVLVDELIQAGLVSEAGHGDSSGGRPPIVLEFNPDAVYALGAHLVDEEWTVVLTNLDGVVLSSAHSPIPQASPGHAADVLTAMIRDLLKENPEISVLPAVGIGAPGLVDISAGTIKSAVNINWFNVPFAELIRARLGLETFVINHSKCGALAEMWRDETRRTGDLIYISIGEGISAGIVHQGILYKGVNSSAGELGHTTVVPDGPACPCGNRGCLQQFVSEQAIAVRARELLKAGTPSSLYALAGHYPERLNAFDVIEAAEKGDDLAVRVIDTTAEYLGIAVGNLINLFNPDTIVIGGPVGDASPRLTRVLREQVRYRSLAFPYSAVRIITTELGKDAGAAGAAVLVLQQAFRLYGRAFHGDPGQPDSQTG